MNSDQELNLGQSSGSPSASNANNAMRSAYGTLPRASVLYSRFQPSNELPGIIRFLLKIKIVKNEKQAEKLILLLILFIIAASTALFIFAFQEPEITI
jgi:hypothetical protein